MATTIVLYTKPDDVDGFEQYYRETHVPLANDLENLQGLAASRIVGTPRGTEAPYYLKAELSFADMDTMGASLRSEQGMKVSRDAMEMCQRFGMSAEIMLADDL
jgi:uncharacterized protein (TIGR02118 family)